MNHTDLISGFFFLVLGLILTVWATKYPVDTLTNPGIGLFPLLIGALLIVFSVILLVQRSAKEARALPSFLKGGRKKVAYTVSILVLAALFFETMGYLLTVFFLMLALMITAEFRNWKTILVIALFATLGVYLGFVLILKQPLPQGPLGV